MNNHIFLFDVIRFGINLFAGGSFGALISKLIKIVFGSVPWTSYFIAICTLFAVGYLIGTTLIH